MPIFFLFLTGKIAGEKARTEAGSKINIPKILSEAIAAAKDAAEKAARLAQASEQVEKFILICLTVFGN